MKKKILVAVDGSHYSINEIRYLALMFEGMDDICFHLYLIVSGGSQPLGSDWLDKETMENVMPAAVQKRFRLARKKLQEEAGVLSRKGFGSDQVKVSVVPMRMGVAADLIREARKGAYDALVMGRRGLGRIQEMVLGSVSAAVLGKCFDVPLWVLDGEVESRRILVPLDGSIHTLRAVEHLGHIMQGVPGVEITLFHSAAIFKSRPREDRELICAQWGEEWCAEFLNEDDYIFRGPEQVLREAGFDMERVRRADEGRGLEPARDIYLQIRYKKFGTVVMGRRLLEESRGVMGSVSGRLLRVSRNVVVCLVH